MSLEAAIAELTQSNLALIAQLKITGENQERLIAGQVAAIDKVEAPKAARTRAKAAETPAAGPTEQKQPETPPAVEPTGGDLPTVSDAELKATAQKYLGLDQDPKSLTERRNFVAAVMKELDTPMLCGEKSTLDNDGRCKAAFYIMRATAGLAVDFN